MKKIFFTLLFFLVFIIPVSAIEIDTSLKVYDYADLLTDDEEFLLRQQAQLFVEEYDMDLIILTTSYNEGLGTQGYAQDFYDYNGFGVGNTHDGILFLIDRTYGYNDTWMVTTGHAILVYDDSRIDSILDDIYYSKDRGYYAMFETFIKSSSDYAKLGIAPSNENMYIDENGNYLPKYDIDLDDFSEKREFPLLPSLIISFAVSTIIVVILLLRNKMIKKETRAAAYLDQSTINFTRKEDRFITTHTTRTYSPRNTSSSSSGGGSRGGSSISRGSSGRSHGGGGRRM